MIGVLTCSSVPILDTTIIDTRFCINILISVKIENSFLVI
jgi:hypothetical protein